MFRSFLLVTLLAAVLVQAQINFIPGDCGTLKSPWSLTDASSAYKVNSTLNKRACALPFITPCRTDAGLVACNNYNQQCVDLTKDTVWDDAVLHPTWVANLAQRPQVCISKGQILHPDAGISMIAIIIFGWIVATLSLLLLLFTMSQYMPGLIVLIVVGALWLFSGILLFSFYFLNGILCFACAYAAYALFAAKTHEGMGFSFVLILFALFWVTFDNGLGKVQHMGRFNALNSGMTCENYYRGYFWVAQISDFANPAELHSKDRFCDRNWLATELFFMILVELLFTVLIAAGGVSCFTEPLPAQPTDEAHGQEMAAQA